MGVIQNAINRTIGMVGTAARFSPGYERREKMHEIESARIKELATLDKEQEIVNQQAESAELKGKDATDPALISNIGDISRRRMEVAQRKFQLDPTEENFKSAVDTEKSYRAFNNYEATMLERQRQKQEEAMLSVGVQQDTKKQQKRNFMEYLGKLETSMGMNVGDLPPHMLKEIAKQYTKSERKKLMDEEDKKR